MNQVRIHRSRLNVKVVWRTIVCGVFALVGAGCCGGDGGTAEYSPSADTARQALESALAAWKHGGPPGKITGTSTAVEVADSKRQAGQTLASYEILGEVPDDGAKRFSVRLKLENPTQERETQYVVVGRDPIWVFGEADYAQEKGM